jgi:hypothetical protein
MKTVAALITRKQNLESNLKEDRSLLLDLKNTFSSEHKKNGNLSNDINLGKEIHD